ncbi:peptide-methionine (R)-S-oxide reductase MsrB [Afifella aestuarii]|uniref:peptide-methionine (R)-S-oxide reductase MsrB n=1 Tax=Afifella aestuarii TaxID=1909496 RepID=UPI000FE43DE1|nr:peptide-methionine (R)-S-oxide reductase MsrB [Afifella aestuarii]
MLSRRSLFAGSAAVAALTGIGVFSPRRADAEAAGDFPVTLSRDEWKKKLTDRQFSVLRDEGTERAYTSPLNDEHREGVFHCAGCDNAVYSSKAKFDSGTGWPSFYEAIAPAAVATSRDFKLIYPRTEVHCANCGGHLGHVFNDGPKPTGKRHCINGVALVFKPAGGGDPVLG